MNYRSLAAEALRSFRALQEGNPVAAAESPVGTVPASPAAEPPAGTVILSDLKFHLDAEAEKRIEAQRAEYRQMLGL